MSDRIFGFRVPAARYPPDPRSVFLLFACVVTGPPLILGISEPKSVAAFLPAWAVTVWGTLLTIGAVLSLVGMARQNLSGIIAEQVGSVTVGVACVIYATSILFYVGWQGALPAGLILSWGLSCFWRWVQLQLLVLAAVREAADHAG